MAAPKPQLVQNPQFIHPSKIHQFKLTPGSKFACGPLAPDKRGTRDPSRFTLGEMLWLIKQGLEVPSNTNIDHPFIDSNLYPCFPPDVLRIFANDSMATSTLVIAPPVGQALGEKIVFSDGDRSATAIINRAFQSLAGRSLAIDLLPENFNVRFFLDGRGVEIELLEQAVLLRIARDRRSAYASAATHYLPIEGDSDEPWRLLKISEKPTISLILRGYESYDDGRGVLRTVSSPSEMRRLLVYKPQHEPAMA